MENRGSVVKMIKMKIAEGINILLEHKSISLFGSLQIIHVNKNVHVHMCMHVQIYMYIWTKAHTYVQNMKISYM